MMYFTPKNAKFKFTFSCFSLHSNVNVWISSKTVNLQANLYNFFDHVGL